MSIDFMILRIGDEIAEYTNCDEVDLAEALTAIEPILQEQATITQAELDAKDARISELEFVIEEIIRINHYDFRGHEIARAAIAKERQNE